MHHDRTPDPGLFATDTQKIADLHAQLSDIIFVRVDTNVAFEQLGRAWSSADVTSAYYDAHRGTLTLRANNVTASLALQRSEDVSQVMAMVKMEPTRIHAVLVEGHLRLVCSARKWQYWLHPESAVIID
jgi:hypothetical protein